MVFRTMHLFIPHLLLVLMPRVVECISHPFFRDLSDACAKGQNISICVTTGMGTSDSLVVIIAKSTVHCKIEFCVRGENNVILVLEFPDWMPGRHPCGNDVNTVKVTISNNSPVNVCSYLQDIKDNLFRFVGRNGISLLIKSGSDFETLKIVATSMIGPVKGNCDEANEIRCIFQDQKYCMTRSVQCDKILNCGVREEFDEDYVKCSDIRSLGVNMIFSGLGMVCVTFFLLIAVLRNVLPKRKGSFIFKEDETLSDKDRATSQKNVQVKLRVLFHPNEEANPDVYLEDPTPTRRRTTLALPKKITFRRL